MNPEPRTDFLFARPTLLEGAARIFDFAGTMTQYNVSPSGEIADLIALWMDWAVIGNDLRGAMNMVGGDGLHLPMNGD